ncbi:MAG: hypothetical protein UY19_C0030G0001, partial [Candidatus Wolfebacteria bacterium GW2011_GWA2_47_9b]
MRQSIDRHKVRSIVWQYYLFSGCFTTALSFIFSTYSVFLIAKGFDLLQMNLVNCFFVVGVFCMEIPTGAYADVLGRRNSFIAACFVLSAAMGIYYMADSFWMCVLAELIGAAGSAFCSGSLEAWAVDSVKHTGMRGQLHSIFRREQYVVRIGSIIGSLLGGYIAQGDLASHCSVNTSQIVNGKKVGASVRPGVRLSSSASGPVMLYAMSTSPRFSAASRVDSSGITR